MKIDKKDWLVDTFGRVEIFSDLLRLPESKFLTMSSSEKDKLRQTQVIKDEIIQILGQHEGFYLSKKFEGTLGWIKCESVTLDPLVQTFPAPESKILLAEDFLSHWKGTVYEFGGLSKNGIDCSGFTQLFYLHVLGITLPKNSFDQRKLGKPKDLTEIEDFDLIFCNPIGLKDHHVVLFYKDKYWHSRRKGGVVAQTREEFLADFKVEEVRSISGV